MSSANPLSGAPRIHGELLKLGITVSQATVSKYMLRPRRPPSQAWRTFLKNHAQDLIALDFFTVPTKDAPKPRSVQAPSEGRVVEVPRVGGCIMSTCEGVSRSDE